MAANDSRHSAATRRTFKGISRTGRSGGWGGRGCRDLQLEASSVTVRWATTLVVLHRGDGWSSTRSLGYLGCHAAGKLHSGVVWNTILPLATAAKWQIGTVTVKEHLMSNRAIETAADVWSETGRLLQGEAWWVSTVRNCLFYVEHYHPPTCASFQPRWEFYPADYSGTLEPSSKYLQLRLCKFNCWFYQHDVQSIILSTCSHIFRPVEDAKTPFH